MIGGMMKRLFLSLALLTAVGVATLPVVHAADTSAKTAKKAAKGKADKADKAEKAPKASGAVGEFLSQLEDENIWAGEKPAIDADFYIYLTSASWCQFCNEEMPSVVEAYAKMRKNGRVELIQISGDKVKEKAQGFAEKYNATFPVLNPNGVTDKLPGYTAPTGLPDAIVVDSDGNVIKQGSGSIIKGWEGMTINHPDYANKSKADSTKRKAAKDKKAADRKGGAVLSVLKDLKPFNGKVNAKADYFIYLQVDSTDDKCVESMEKVADLYKDIKKSGRVDMVVVSLDETEEAAKAFMRKSKLKCATVMDMNEKIDDLPGLGKANGLPYAIFVDKKGVKHMEGGMSVLEQWENYTIKRRENTED